MAEEMSYDDILDQSFDDLQDAKTLPNGEWLLRARNAAFIAPKNEGQNGRVLIFYTPVEPVNVDSDDLAALGDDYDVSENQIVFQVWIEGNRSWKDVMTHLKKHAGIDLSSGTIRDVLKKGIKNTEVVATLGQRTYENSFGELTLENTASGFRPVE